MPRFRSNALVFQLAVDFPLHTLGIDFSFFDFFCFNWRAEFQLMPVFEQKIIHFIIFRLCAERNLADLIFVAVYTLKQSNPKGIFIALPIQKNLSDCHPFLLSLSAANYFYKIRI